MAREFSRSKRVEDAIQRILSEALSVRVRDPRLHGVGISHVAVSRDVSSAKVYFSRLDGDLDDPSLAAAFESAKGFLRTAIARELRLRQVPELRFLPDHATERARSLEALIEKAVRAEGPVPGAAADDQD